MSIEVTFRVQPEVDATDEQIEEWIHFCLGYTGGCSIENPLCDYDIETYTLFALASLLYHSRVVDAKTAKIYSNVLSGAAFALIVIDFVLRVFLDQKVLVKMKIACQNNVYVEIRPVKDVIICGFRVVVHKQVGSDCRPCSQFVATDYITGRKIFSGFPIGHLLLLTKNFIEQNNAYYDKMTRQFPVVNEETDA